MRDPERIDRILGLLRWYWLLHPDVRLLQLLHAIAGGRDAFYVEDDETEHWLRVMLGEVPSAPTG